MAMYRPWTPLIVPPSLNGRTLEHLLNALVAIDKDYLAEFPRTPLLYDVRPMIHYQAEPPGEEKWLTVPWIIACGAGDCLPVSTLVRREYGALVPIALLQPGDRIVGDGAVTTVKASAVTGKKAILSFSLDNNTVLRMSPEHRAFRADENVVRGEDIREGSLLKGGRRDGVRVQVVQEEESELCADITTDTGRFYLPESDTIVHNCEDLACWRAAELQLRGENAQPSWSARETPQGLLYHIQVKREDGTTEDPNMLLGMGWEKEFARKHGPIKGRLGTDPNIPWQVKR